MNKIEKLIKEFCPDGVEWKKLGEVCNISTGKLNANVKVENGKYPFFTCNEIPSKIDTYSFDTTAILLSGNGSRIGHVNLYSGKFDAYQRTYVIEISEENIHGEILKLPKEMLENVTLTADEHLEYGYIVEVMSKLRNENVKNVSLNIQKNDK